MVDLQPDPARLGMFNGVGHRFADYVVRRGGDVVGNRTIGCDVEVDRQRHRFREHG